MANYEALIQHAQKHGVKPMAVEMKVGEIYRSGLTETRVRVTGFYRNVDTLESGVLWEEVGLVRSSSYLHACSLASWAARGYQLDERKGEWPSYTRG